VFFDVAKNFPDFSFSLVADHGISNFFDAMIPSRFLSRPFGRKKTVQ